MRLRDQARPLLQRQRFFIGKLDVAAIGLGDDRPGGVRSSASIVSRVIEGHDHQRRLARLQQVTHLLQSALRGVVPEVADDAADACPRRVLGGDVAQRLDRQRSRDDGQGPGDERLAPCAMRGRGVVTVEPQRAVDPFPERRRPRDRTASRSVPHSCLHVGHGGARVRVGRNTENGGSISQRAAPLQVR